MWTVVWPIAPLFAYINNFFELRGDALKLATQCRRPVPERVDTIGPWLDALRFLAWFGALVNAALVYLFRPSPQANAAAIAHAVREGDQSSAGVTEKAAAFVSSHIGRAMSLGGGDSGGDDRYYTLRAVLFSAILVALAAEHVQLLVRSAMAHLAEHLFWIGSEAEIRQRKADWELKRSFLATMNMDTEGRKLVRGDTVKSLDGAGDGDGDWAKTVREEGETSEEGKRFWNRKDQGSAEVDRATKTD